MAKEKNVIEYAHKVLSFRMNIAKACKAKNIEVPSDEKIGEYISLYGFNLNDFMSDYMEKEGIFRDPINDFVKDIQAMELDNPPSEEDIRKYAEEHDLDIAKFVKYHNIQNFKGVMKEVLLKTLEFDDKTLVYLWNLFIKESGLYGENSYIYDLENEGDVDFILQNWPAKMKAELTRMTRGAEIKGDKIRFIQWFADTTEKIYVKKDIAAIIIAYWGEIFERIIEFPTIYNRVNVGQSNTTPYFTDIVWEVIKNKVDLKEV